MENMEQIKSIIKDWELGMLTETEAKYQILGNLLPVGTVIQEPK